MVILRYGSNALGIRLVFDSGASYSSIRCDFVGGLDGISMKEQYYECLIFLQL